jgi:hypothetical protein
MPIAYLSGRMRNFGIATKGPQGSFVESASVDTALCGRGSYQDMENPK